MRGGGPGRTKSFEALFFCLKSAERGGGGGGSVPKAKAVNISVLYCEEAKEITVF